MVIHFEVDLGNQLIQTDPIRVMEAVITGVSFLGAGTIIRHRGSQHVEGLTTAASLLFVAGIGISIALGHAILAIGLTILGLIILRGVSWLRKLVVGQEE
jgi:putative Mg2+ transporter-C (MgtC) family protein